MSEQTHAKNLDNLRTGISICQSIGAPFAPTNALITLAALQAYETQIEAALQAVNDVLPAEENTVDARMAAFKLVSKRITKILNAAKGQGLTSEFLAGLRTTANEIRGIRVTPKTEDDPNTPGDESTTSISSSNRSYAGMLEAIDKFVEQLKSNGDYAPNEVDYQTVTLEAWLANLNLLNQNAINAKGPTRAARNVRNELMYNDTNGLIVRAKILKNYVRSILDTSDTRYIQLNRLKFTDFR